MEDQAGTIARPRELLFVSLAGVALSILMTWPLATGLGSLGRTRSTDADGLYSIWNVAWVARTLVADPAHLIDANIFFPHRTTLAYSEANLLEGTIGAPVYWITGNPYATLNVVLLFAFASAFVCAFLLFRYLTGDRRAAAVGAVLYAFCPYVFSHLSHIQLLVTGGIPLSMLMLHRIADVASATTPLASAFRRKDIWRGLALGLALAAQAMSCAYYGIFAGLMVGYATLVLAATRRLWASAPYWTAIATGAASSVLVVLPFFVPYVRVKAQTGFNRTLVENLQASANPQSYLASSAHAHAWLLDIARRFPIRWSEPLFPGLLAVTLGAFGLVLLVARRPDRTPRDRETAILYGTLAALACWASFGPPAGLYRALSLLPIFSFVRAPSRFGLIVVFGLAVFATFALRHLLDLAPAGRRTAVAAIAGALAIGDLAHAPITWWRAPSLPAPYAVLAHLPRGPVAEFPFYGERLAFPLHTQYMLFSTAHWMPLANGYSDIIPADFRADAPVLDSFPSRDAFLALARRRVRYVTIHWDMFGPRQDLIRRRLAPFAMILRTVASDERMTLYEVIGYP
jgi:hypothetical protein